MEIFGYHPDLKKWTEIGNSGMFRPEMLLPMGLPKVCVCVCADPPCHTRRHTLWPCGVGGDGESEVAVSFPLAMVVDFFMYTDVIYRRGGEP